MKSIFLTEVPISDQEGNPPALHFDATVSLVPKYSKNLTKHPISDKSSITNHSVKNNMVVSITGYISKMPIEIYENNLAGYTSKSGRPREALQVLKSWWHRDTELYFADQFDVYDGYVITDLTPQVEGTYAAVRFDLILEKVRRVSYEKVTLTLFMDAEKEQSAKGAKNKGSTAKIEKTQSKWAKDEIASMISSDEGGGADE